ncbi:cation transporter [Spinellus fusiger]|nr:cation transporter [Spinellus fusiger]
MREPINKSQLTKEQRYRLGGTEYRAIDTLSHIIPMYYVGFILVCGLLYRLYIACSSHARHVLQTSNDTGIPVNPWLFSFYISLSAFNNLGLSLVDDSMVPFQNSPFPLLLTAFLILIGNTGYAIMLRCILWLYSCCVPLSYGLLKETLHYLLDHPRRCYTTLFPAAQTRWLLGVLLMITMVEVVSFLALNYWLPVLEGISWGSRFMVGLFQSIATRNAGFNVVSLMDLNPGTQLVYIVAMYISVYPVSISIRNSNIYQERALGIFRHEQPHEHIHAQPKRRPTVTGRISTTRHFLSPDFFVMTQIQRQLTSEICWLVVGVFLVCVIESGPIMQPSPITISSVIYECVSAFGNVGASLGYPNTAFSQAGQYRTPSKLVLCLLMYRGRHRGNLLIHCWWMKRRI